MSEIEMKDIILMKKTWNRLEVEVDVDRLDMRTFNPVGSGLETSCVSSICQNLSIPGSCAVRLPFVFRGHSFLSADSFKIVRLLLVLIKVLLLKVVADSVAWLFLPRTSCTFSWRSLSFSTCTPKAIPSNTSVGGRSIYMFHKKNFSSCRAWEYLTRNAWQLLSRNLVWLCPPPPCHTFFLHLATYVLWKPVMVCPFSRKSNVKSVNKP